MISHASTTPTFPPSTWNTGSAADTESAEDGGGAGAADG